MSFSALKISRFDKIVALLLIVMAIITALMVWRGDQVGVQIIGVNPADGATAVSTKSDIQITFDQIMATSNTVIPLEVDPPVNGTVRWNGASLIFSPETSFAPDTTYSVKLTDQLTSQSGRVLLDQPAWQFQTGQPDLVYVAPDENAVDQIYLISPLNLSSEPLQLTQEQYGVFDYALSFDGATIAFAALRDDGGSDLKQVSTHGNAEASMLLECPEAVCNGAAWMPDGERLIYERRNMLVPGSAPGPPRLFWLSADSQETVIVFDDSQILGYGARWSPKGAWLSYVAPSSQGVQLYNIENGRSFVIPSRMGGIAVWNPQGDTVLVTDIQRSDQGGFAVHLLRAVPESGELQDISGEDKAVEDTAPMWSPDGEWVALTRKTAGASMGKQLWIMRPDGTEGQSLTDDPEIHHAFPAWSPDGRYLAYQRFPLKELNVQPTLWLVDLETGEAKELVTPGNRPTWLP